MGKQTIADIGATCWKCGEVIKFGDDDGCTYPTNPAKYAHAECPVDRTMNITINNSSTTRMLKKCPQCGFPEHNATHCPYVRPEGEQYEYAEGMLIPKAEPSLSLLIVDFGDSCAVKVEKGALPYMQMVPVSIAEAGGGVTLANAPFTDIRTAIDAHFAEDKPVLPSFSVYEDVERRKDILKFGVIEITSGDRQKLCEIAGQLNYVLGAERELRTNGSIFEPKQGKWTDLNPSPEIGLSWELPVNIWRYER